MKKGKEREHGQDYKLGGGSGTWTLICSNSNLSLIV